MAKAKHVSLWKIYGFSTLISIALIALAGINSGLKGLVLVLALAALEVSLSFDNAVVNAKILKRMSAAWRKAFLTIGIFIAVFGVRVILPIFLVSIAVGSSFKEIIDLARNNPTEYGHKLHEAHPLIAAFGGIFLLMIFLDYFFEARKVKWIDPLENFLENVGKPKGFSTLVAVGALAAVTFIVDRDHMEVVWFAGLTGLAIYLLIHIADRLLQNSSLEKNLEKGVSATFKAGLIGFIYLEIIDASFSLDGVVGAFAITNQILLIAIGLGIGALFVRTITLHMLQRGVLDEYRYIEHGAHYAIGILAIIMLVSLKVEVPEVVTGLTGLLVIIASVIHSKKVK